MSGAGQTMPENTTRRPQTDDEAYVQAAQRPYETVASKLEALAARVREQGTYVGTGNVSAVYRAAEMVNDFTQGVGSIGSFLWAVVNDAEHLDRFRREADKTDGVSESSAVTR